MAKEISNAAAERELARKSMNDLPDRPSYTAKQVATRCGTDAKTLRKFLRSSHSTAEPVGQGGRYEFDASDLPLIKREFAAWRKKAEARKPAAKPESKVIGTFGGVPIVEDEEELEVEDDRDPTPEELEALEELNLDEVEDDD